MPTTQICRPGVVAVRRGQQQQDFAEIEREAVNMDVQQNENKVIELIALDDLTPVQVRAAMRPEVVRELKSVLADGGELEPGVVIREGAKLWLASGCHRREAYRAAGHSQMPVVIREGTRLDALVEGVESNKSHVGGMWTRADKRNAAEEILLERPTESDRVIAALVGLSPTTVGAYRAGLVATVQIGQSDARVGADGVVRHTPTLDSNSSKQAGQEEAAVSPVCAVDVTPVVEQHVADEPAEDAPGAAWPCVCEWESSGEGWRYCVKCGRIHPDDSGPDEEGETQAVAVNDSTPKTESAKDVPGTGAVDLAKQFDALFRILGQLKRDADTLRRSVDSERGYRRVLYAANRLDEEIEAWRREVLAA